VYIFNQTYTQCYFLTQHISNVRVAKSQPKNEWNIYLILGVRNVNQWMHYIWLLTHIKGRVFIFVHIVLQLLQKLVLKLLHFTLIIFIFLITPTFTFNFTFLFYYQFDWNIFENIKKLIFFNIYWWNLWRLLDLVGMMGSWRVQKLFYARYFICSFFWWKIFHLP
jgi:hypothetical protein